MFKIHTFFLLALSTYLYWDKYLTWLDLLYSQFGKLKYNWGVYIKDSTFFHCQEEKSYMENKLDNKIVHK